MMNKPTATPEVQQALGDLFQPVMELIEKVNEHMGDMGHDGFKLKLSNEHVTVTENEVILKLPVTMTITFKKK